MHQLYNYLTPHQQRTTEIYFQKKVFVRANDLVSNQKIVVILKLDIAASQGIG